MVLSFMFHVNNDEGEMYFSKDIVQGLIVDCFNKTV